MPGEYCRGCGRHVSKFPGEHPWDCPIDGPVSMTWRRYCELCGGKLERHGWVCMTCDVSQSSRPQKRFSEGDRIRVVRGPFGDFDGVVLDTRSGLGSIVAEISIFGRMTRVQFSPSDLELISLEQTRHVTGSPKPPSELLPAGDFTAQEPPPPAGVSPPEVTSYPQPRVLEPQQPATPP